MVGGFPASSLFGLPPRGCIVKRGGEGALQVGVATCLLWLAAALGWGGDGLEVFCLAWGSNLGPSVRSVVEPQGQLPQKKH